MEWQPIETAKKLKKGFLRVYSYKPALNGRYLLQRINGFESSFGSRECDLYIDIPEPPEAT